MSILQPFIEATTPPKQRSLGTYITTMRVYRLLITVPSLSVATVIQHSDFIILGRVGEGQFGTASQAASLTKIRSTQYNTDLTAESTRGKQSTKVLQPEAITQVFQSFATDAIVGFVCGAPTPSGCRLSRPSALRGLREPHGSTPCDRIRAVRNLVGPDSDWRSDHQMPGRRRSTVVVIATRRCDLLGSRPRIRTSRCQASKLSALSGR